jgi:hypothetical protein
MNARRVPFEAHLSGRGYALGGFSPSGPCTLSGSGQAGVSARRHGNSTMDICPRLDRIAWVEHGREVVNQAPQQAKERIGRGCVKEHRNRWNGENND